LLLLNGYDHFGWPEQLIALPVTRLHHFHDCACGHACPGVIDRGHCFVPVGVERLALIANGLDPFSAQKLLCGLIGQVDTLAQAATIARLGGQGPLQVIHERQKATQEPLALGIDCILGQTLLSLAIVIHLGLQAERPVTPVDRSSRFDLAGLLGGRRSVAVS
jgi:hypothetical protein